MRTPKYFYHTVDMLKDKMKTKMNLRERLVDKISKYDVEIKEIEIELIQRNTKS